MNLLMVVKREFLDAVQRVLDWTGLGLVALAVAGLCARAAGWFGLPWTPLVLGLLGTGVAALALNHGLRSLRRFPQPGFVRWSRAVASLMIVAFTLTEVGGSTHLWGEDVAAPVFASILGLAVIGGAVALLVDAAAMRGRMPRLAVLGAVAGSAGLVALIVGMVADLNSVYVSAYPLFAFAGIAYFRVRDRLSAVEAAAEATVRGR